MLRGVGALLLAGSGLTLGLKVVGELAGQLRDLRDLCTALAMLEGELDLSLPTTPALLSVLADRAPGRTSTFFHHCVEGLDRLGDKSFGEIWTGALAVSDLRLTTEGRRCLLALGTALGRYDAGQLQNCCRQCRQDLEREGAALEAALQSRGRAYSTLGLSLGVFLAILFW